MGRIAFLPLVTIATVIGIWMGATKSGSAHPAILQVSQASVGSPQLVIDKQAITVIGQGLATAPADKALLEFRFVSRLSPEPPEETAPVEGDELLTRLALQPVINALVAFKVPANNIEVRVNSIENPSLRVNLDKPTRERVREVVNEVRRAVRGSNNIFLQGVGAEYAVNNCQPLERKARQIALSDAQNQVKTIASDLGVKVGDLLLVTVFPVFGPPSSSACGSKVAVSASPFSLASESTPPYNPSTPTEVQVRSQISITYAISPAGREKGKGKGILSIHVGEFKIWDTGKFKQAIIK